jgi:DNA repair ATPase RecN
MDTEEQLRSTSDQVMSAIEQLHRLETEKRGLPPTSPRFQKLAGQVEQVANKLVDTAAEQADLGEQLAERQAAAGETGTPIRDIERDMNTILAEWRDAERRVAAATPGSPEEAAARADVERLRAEYQQAQANANDA